jgi:hypothetical protein
MQKHLHVKSCTTTFQRRMKAPTPALPQEPQPKKTPTENKKKKKKEKTLLLPNKQALMLSNFEYNLLSKS